jgi:hypothetical protein
MNTETVKNGHNGIAKNGTPLPSRKCQTCERYESQVKFPPDRKTSNPKAWTKWTVCQGCYDKVRTNAGKKTSHMRAKGRLDTRQAEAKRAADRKRKERDRWAKRQASTGHAVKHRAVAKVNEALAAVAPGLPATVRILGVKLLTMARLRGWQSITIDVAAKAIVVRTISEERVSL